MKETAGNLQTSPLFLGQAPQSRYRCFVPKACVLQDVRLLYRALQRSQTGPPSHTLIGVAQLEMEIGRGSDLELESHLFELDPLLETVMGEPDRPRRHRLNDD